MPMYVKIYSSTLNVCLVDCFYHLKYMRKVKSKRLDHHVLLKEVDLQIKNSNLLVKQLMAYRRKRFCFI